MRDSNLLRGAGVVVLALALMECGYRVVFWHWMAVSTPGEAAAAATHMRSWVVATVVLGLAWLYLTWRLLMEERADRRSRKAVGNTKKTQV
jgi:heme/copper-type cytochrome/quinol oxidase subunit 2